MDCGVFLLGLDCEFVLEGFVVVAVDACDCCGIYGEGVFGSGRPVEREDAAQHVEAVGEQARCLHGDEEGVFVDGHAYGGGVECGEGLVELDAQRMVELLCGAGEGAHRQECEGHGCGCAIGCEAVGGLFVGFFLLFLFFLYLRVFEEKAEGVGGPDEALERVGLLIADGEA